MPVAASIYEWLVVPATVLHSVLGAWAPAMAAFFDNAMDHGDWRIPVALSLCVWLLLGFGVFRALRFVFHQVLFVWRTLAARLFSVRLTGRMRLEQWQAAWAERFPGATAGGDAPEVQLGDDAVAIMRLAAALTPGQTLSAPELATELGVTPKTVQRRLEQLATLQLLEPTSSSTDGFRDYRLSRPGEMYVELWREPQPVQPS